MTSGEGTGPPPGPLSERLWLSEGGRDREGPCPGLCRPKPLGPAVPLHRPQGNQAAGAAAGPKPGGSHPSGLSAGIPPDVLTAAPSRSLDAAAAHGLENHSGNGPHDPRRGWGAAAGARLEAPGGRRGPAGAPGAPRPAPQKVPGAPSRLKAMRTGRSAGTLAALIMWAPGRRPSPGASSCGDKRQRH